MIHACTTLGCVCVFPGVFLISRVTGACPVTTDLIMRVNVRTTTTTSNTSREFQHFSARYLPPPTKTIFHRKRQFFRRQDPPLLPSSNMSQGVPLLLHGRDHRPSDETVYIYRIYNISWATPPNILQELHNNFRGCHPPSSPHAALFHGDFQYFCAWDPPMS